MAKNLIKFLIGFLAGILIFWLIISKIDNSKEEQVAVSYHHEIVERIESIGNLELVRMNVRDILEHEIIRQWFPNARAVLIINGEAAGSIDLKKLRPEDIFISKDSLSIKLPAPAISYCKIDHNKSRVFDTQNNFFSGAKLIDDAYREAERHLCKTVMDAGILNQTKVNAVAFFRPFFESLGFKRIHIYFED